MAYGARAAMKYLYLTRCRRYGNLEEEEKRGFMGAINVQDFNPNIRIFVQALTVGMRQRLIKVDIHSGGAYFHIERRAFSWKIFPCSTADKPLRAKFGMNDDDGVRLHYVDSRTNCFPQVRGAL